jgi:hypothetical protein
MSDPRRPKNYVGLNHVTIGSDILAVMRAVHVPEQVLGPEMAAQIRAVRPNDWYPIQQLLDIFEVLDHKLGRYALVAMGWGIFTGSHEAKIKHAARSARDIVHGIDTMYKNANRGFRIGGWEVLKFEKGRAELEKTTPHHCVVEEGILQEALRCVGVAAQVSQTDCFRKGADACHYVITSAVTDHRWSQATAM